MPFFTQGLDTTIRWNKSPTFHSHESGKGHLLQARCISSPAPLQQHSHISSLLMSDLHFYFCRGDPYDFTPLSAIIYSWSPKCTNVQWDVNCDMHRKNKLQPEAKGMQHSGDCNMLRKFQDAWSYMAYFMHCWDFCIWALALLDLAKSFWWQLCDTL